MTSQRKFKKRAEAQGMTGPELQLVEMVQEMMHDIRWMQILAYSNQYLLNRKLKVTDSERDQILEAATRAVDKDGKLHEWSVRLDRLKNEILNIKRKVNRARKDLEQDKPAPPTPSLPESLGGRAAEPSIDAEDADPCAGEASAN